MSEWKIGINGIAGRIGRLTAYDSVQLVQEIGAVNDLVSTEKIVESLRGRDKVYGTKLAWDVEMKDESTITINGKEVRVHHERDPANITWGKDIYAVDECTGFFVKREDAERHFTKNEETLNNVILSAPGKGKMKMLVMGVNHEDYDPTDTLDQVISNASCTTKALVMPLYALEEQGLCIDQLSMVTIHSVTNTQLPVEAINNILPASTGAAVAAARVMPSLEERMYGIAMRVPISVGSSIFASAAICANNLSRERVNEIFRNASKNPAYQGRLISFEGPIDTSEVRGMKESAVIDLAQTNIGILNKMRPIEDSYSQGALVTFVSNYDNEMGPAKDLALLTKYIGQRGGLAR